MTEFTPDQIKKVLNEVLGDKSPVFNTVFDISIFASEVGKRLIDTVNNEKISLSTKLELVINISEQIVEELENRAIITLELANQYREVLANGSEAKNLISQFAKFTESTPEEKKEMIGCFFNNCLNFFFTKNTTADDNIFEPKKVEDETDDEIDEVVAAVLKKMKTQSSTLIEDCGVIIDKSKIEVLSDAEIDGKN